MMPRLRVTDSTIVAIVTLAASLYLLWHTYSPVYDTVFATAGRGPVFFPRILLVIIAALATLTAAQSLLNEHDRIKWRSLASFGLAAGITAGYIYLITVIGFLLATMGFCVALPLAFGYRRLMVIAGFSIVYATTAWYLFEVVFRIVLPKSPWFSSF